MTKKIRRLVRLIADITSAPEWDYYAPLHKEILEDMEVDAKFYEKYPEKLKEMSDEDLEDYRGFSMSTYWYDLRDIITRFNGSVSRELQRRHDAIMNRGKAVVVREWFEEIYDGLFQYIGEHRGFRCQKCQSETGLCLVHKVSPDDGGENDLPNIEMLCQECKDKKGERK